MSAVGIFVALPWLALLPALVFGALAVRNHRRLVWLAAAAWLFYSAYETAMSRRILCSGDCNIRVDLLVIYPVLALLSLAGVISALRRRRAAA